MASVPVQIARPADVEVFPRPGPIHRCVHRFLALQPGMVVVAFGGGLVQILPRLPVVAVEAVARLGARAGEGRNRVAVRRGPVPIVLVGGAIPARIRRKRRKEGRERGAREREKGRVNRKERAEWKRKRKRRRK